MDFSNFEKHDVVYIPEALVYGSVVSINDDYDMIVQINGEAIHASTLNTMFGFTFERVRKS